MIRQTKIEFSYPQDSGNAWPHSSNSTENGENATPSSWSSLAAYY